MPLETGGLLSHASACPQSLFGQEMGGVPIVQSSRRGLGKVWKDCATWAGISRTHSQGGECTMSSEDPGGSLDGKTGGRQALGQGVT